MKLDGRLVSSAVDKEGRVVEIIDFAREKRERERPTSYFVRVDQFADGGVEGAVLDIGSEPSPEDLRRVSRHLAALSRMLASQAERIDHDEDETLLAEVRVYKSSRVNIWCDNDVQTPEQMEWMDRRLDDAKPIMRPKAEQKTAY